MERRFSTRAWLAVLALITVATGAQGCALSATRQAPASPAATATALPEGLGIVQATALPPAEGELSIPEVARRVRPAVVQVTNQREVGVEQFGRPVPETAGIGSGFIYDPSGLILTNDHVVAGADQLVVALPDGRTFQARVIGQDPQTDLAVIKIDGENLPLATLGSAGNLVVGQTVVAIGNALGLDGGPTVTEGIVSALGRAIQIPSPPPEDAGTPRPGPRAGTFLFDLVQTDAPINPGNSGGPLVDLLAQVVGINTLVATSTAGGVPVEGIGFAISIDTARRIAAQLVATGRAVHPFLGIEYVPLNPALAARLGAPVQRGMFVTRVIPHSPADDAGLQQADIIISADGQELRSESSLARFIDGRQPGDTVQLTIVRDGERRTVSVTLAQQPAS